MSLLTRDNRVIIPTIQVGAAIGNVDALVMLGAGGSFTEPLDVGTFTEGIVFIKAAAKVGSSPVIDCKVQYGFRDSNNQPVWVDSGDSFTQITDNGIFIKKLTANFGKLIRLGFVIGGTAGPGYTVTARIALKG